MNDPVVSDERKARFEAMQKGTVVVVLNYIPLTADLGVVTPVRGDLGRVVSNDGGIVSVDVPGKKPRGRSHWGFFIPYGQDDLRLATVEEQVAMELMT